MLCRRGGDAEDEVRSGSAGGPEFSALTEGLVGDGACFVEKGEFNLEHTEFEMPESLPSTCLAGGQVCGHALKDAGRGLANGSLLQQRSWTR